MKGLTTRFIIILFSVLFAIYLLIPTLIRYKTGKQIPRVVGENDRVVLQYLPSDTLKLGLDLRGGLHLVLGLDFDEVERDAATKLKSQLKDLADREKIPGISTETAADNTIIIHYPDDATWKKMDGLISKSFGTTVDFGSQTQNAASVKMSSYYDNHVREQAIEQAVETLRNRIDEFGIAEPIITKQGTDKILVEFPGIQDPGRLKDIISEHRKTDFPGGSHGPRGPWKGLSRQGEERNPRDSTS